MRRFLLALGLIACAGAARAQADDPFIGELMLTAAPFCPVDWLAAQGQTLQIIRYEALYSLLGTAFGGDGTTTFKVPDLGATLPVGTALAANANSLRVPGDRGSVAMGQAGQSTVPTLAMTWCIALQGRYPTRE